VLSCFAWPITATQIKIMHDVTKMVYSLIFYIYGAGFSAVLS